MVGCGFIWRQEKGNWYPRHLREERELRVSKTSLASRPKRGLSRATSAHQSRPLRGQAGWKERDRRTGRQTDGGATQASRIARGRSTVRKFFPPQNFFFRRDLAQRPIWTCRRAGFSTLTQKGQDQKPARGIRHQASATRGSSLSLHQRALAPPRSPGPAQTLASGWSEGRSMPHTAFPVSSDRSGDNGQAAPAQSSAGSHTAQPPWGQGREPKTSPSPLASERPRSAVTKPRVGKTTEFTVSRLRSVEAQTGLQPAPLALQPAPQLLGLLQSLAFPVDVL